MQHLELMTFRDRILPGQLWGLVECAPQILAACPDRPARRILTGMGTKSRDRLYSSSIRMAAERASAARKEAERLAGETWTKRVLAFKDPAKPSPSLGDTFNACYTYFEARLLGCHTHQTVALD